MRKKAYATDVVVIAGSVLGLISLLTGWFIVRPNRLADGITFTLMEAAGWIPVSAIIILLLICLILGLMARSKLLVLMLGITANILLIMVFITLGHIPQEFVLSQPEGTRISFDIGIPMAIAGIYIIIFAVQKKLTSHPFIRNLVSYSGLLTFLIMLFSGFFGDLSVLVEYQVQKSRFIQEFLHHIYLVGVSVIAGTIIGVLIGIWATRDKRIENPVFYVVNIVQTIPSLALFGLLIAPLSAISFAYPFLRDIGISGIGDTPAIIALVIYSLLPIARNTFIGLHTLDKSVIDSASGMGMNRLQIFNRIEMPLAAPLIVDGIRIASVQSVGLAAVAALIGAGGLGWFIFQGLGQAATDLILLGAIPIIMLALLMDYFMRIIAIFVRPRGIQERTDD